MPKNYVIIGAGQAGRRTAESLRELDQHCRITLVGKEPDIPYDRPSLSKEGLINEENLAEAFVQSKDFYEQNNIALILNTKVMTIQADQNHIVLDNQQKLPYDKLIITTGSRVRTLDVPGADQADIFYVRTLADSRRLRDAVQTKKQVTVIGGGFIGLEVAATLSTHFDCQVTLLESGSRILKRTMPAELSHYVHDLHEKNGVSIHLDSCVQSIEKTATDHYLIHTNHGVIESELIIVGIGVHPNQELAVQAGIEANNGIVVDAHGRTNVAHIYAAGDVTAHYNPFYQQAVRLESWQVAENQPAIVAQHICGDHEAAFSDLPWLWSDQYDHNLQMLGDFRFATQTVVRQESKDQHFSILGLNEENQLKAVCAVNQGRDISLYKRLMQAGAAIPPERLIDSSQPIRSLRSYY